MSIKEKILKYLPGLTLGSITLLALLAGTGVSSAAILGGFQGGTGYGTGQLGSAAVGLNLQVASTTPFLTYTFAAGSGITSLNGSTSSTQTFATSGPLLSISTANGVHTFTTALSTTGNLLLTGDVLNTVQDIETTSSPTFASGTFSGQINLGTYLNITSTAVQPVVVGNNLVLHDFPGTGNIPRLEADNTYTANGCDVIGQDNCQVVKNNSGVTLTLGQAVYINGGSGANPLVTLSQANATTTATALGLVASSSVPNNAFFLVMTKGILKNVDTSTFSVGSPVYVSPTVAGGLVQSRPLPPNFVTRIGSVQVSNVSNGVIDVSVAPAVLGQETGTNSTTFNIAGVNAVTSSTFANSLSAGSGIGLNTSGGVTTVTNSVVPNYVSSTSAGNNITVSGNIGAITVNARPYSCQWVAVYSTSSSVWNDDFCIFDTTSTLSSVWVKNQTPGDSITWNLYYSNTMPSATTTGSAFLGKVFTSDQVTTATSTASLVSFGSSTPRLGDFMRIVAYNASSSEFSLRLFYNE